MIVARNPNSVKRATSYAERLRLSIAVIHGHGEERIPESEEDDGRNSPPIHETELRPNLSTSSLEILPGMQNLFVVVLLIALYDSVAFDSLEKKCD